MVTSFGADEEEEEEDLMYHWDERSRFVFRLHDFGTT